MRDDQPDLARDEQMARDLQHRELGAVCRFDEQVQLAVFDPCFRRRPALTCSRLHRICLDCWTRKTCFRTYCRKVRLMKPHGVRIAFWTSSTSQMQWPPQKKRTGSVVQQSHSSGSSTALQSRHRNSPPRRRPKALQRRRPNRRRHRYRLGPSPPPTQVTARWPPERGARQRLALVRLSRSDAPPLAGHHNGRKKSTGYYAQA